MKYEFFTIRDNDRISIPSPENYADCFELINSDLYRIQGGDKSRFRLLLRLFTHPFSILPWFRLCQHKGLFLPVCYIMFRICKICQNIDMRIHMKVGFGLYIGHGTSMVINPHTVIGNNVNLSHFLSIGTNHRTPAIIGNEVYIGPGVCIVEDARIGSRSTIGAGAVVLGHIPAGSTVAGVPAKVLNSDNPARYIMNPYPVPDIPRDTHHDNTVIRI